MLDQRTTSRKSRFDRGFTLIELMVTVAVIGIIALIAVPSMEGLITNSRLSGASEEMAASLQLARSEAVRRNARVTVCGSTDGSTCAAGTSWSQLIVRQPNGTADDPAVIREYRPANSVQMTGPNAGVVFRPSGLIDNAQQLQVTKASYSRCLTVQISGVVSVKKVAC